MFSDLDYLLVCSNADNSSSNITRMMERIKRRMIAVNTLEVMRRTFKVGLVMSEETESDLEYDLGEWHYFHCSRSMLISFQSAQTTRKVVYSELVDLHAQSLTSMYPMLFIKQAQKRLIEVYSSCIGIKSIVRR